MVISLEVPIGGPSIHGRTEHALRVEHAPEEQWFAGGADQVSQPPGNSRNLKKEGGQLSFFFRTSGGMIGIR